MSVTKQRQEEIDEIARQAVGFALEMAAEVGADPVQTVLDALREVSDDHCVLCYYKRKAGTGVGYTSEPVSLTPLEEIIRLPQRDGDSGNLHTRMSHGVVILRRMYEVGERGQTDDELQEFTGIFHDSAKGMRANLMKHGWIKATGTKRNSPRERPMEVWVMTDLARTQWEEKGIAA
jgi:hypothetical protein